MEDVIDVESIGESQGGSNNDANSQISKSSRKRKAHGNFDDYFDRVKSGNKIKFVCKLIKEGTTTLCNKEYVGPATSSAM